MVDETFRGILVVCYENVPGHPYTERNHPKGKVVWIVINCPQPELYVEQQTGRVLVVGLDLQVTHAVLAPLVLFILRAV